jgi:ankyrin repeat protein
VSILTVDNQGRTPFSYVAERGYTSIIKLLPGTGSVNPNSVDNQGRTPLSHAAAARKLETAEFLLSTGAVNVNSIDKGGRTPLDWLLIAAPSPSILEYEDFHQKWIRRKNQTEVLLTKHGAMTGDELRRREHSLQESAAAAAQPALPFPDVLIP